MKYCITLLLLSAFAFTLQAQPGTPDRTYGIENTGTVSILSPNYLQASAIQPDDKLLIGGMGNMYGQYVVMRHNKDGTIDTTFGIEGQITVKVDDLVSDIIASDGWNSIAVQPDGKIVAAGLVQWYNPDFPGNTLRLDNDIVLARLLPDGTPDESFGNGGKVVTNLGYLEYPTAIAVQPDGKTVVAGYQYTDLFGNGKSGILVRYNTDGSLDESFGTTGTGWVKNGEGKTYALLLQPDNKIVVGGTDMGNEYFFVARYLPDGTADAAFGSNGTVYTDFGMADEGGLTQVFNLALDAENRIVAAGEIGSGVKGAVARYLPDGALDRSFSENGWLYLPFSSDLYVHTSTVVWQPGDKLIITSLLSPGGGNWQLALTGVNADGSIDETFGNSEGQTIINNGITSADFTQATMQSDGKIIVAGNNYDSRLNQNTYILTRFHGYPQQVPLYVRIKRWLKNHGISWKGLPAQNDIAYYSIEQSNKRTIGFTQIAKVSGVNHLNNYDITNSQLLPGTNYYRIKAVSTDGAIRYSEVVSADNTAATASIYPNPVRDYVTVQGLKTSEQANISIANCSGTILARGVSSGSTQYRTAASNLQPGTYYLNITTNAGKTETLKFVKE